MPSNCSPSNCVGNSCLTKRRKNRSKKSRQTKAISRRFKGGAPPTLFTVVLFSVNPVDKTTRDGIHQLLTSLYGETQMTVEEDGYNFYSFQGSTGINSKLENQRSEITYRVKAAPAILSDKKLSTDKRLTILEGEIGNALLKSPLNVSLIKVAHGLRPNINSQLNSMPNTYYIGLCSPKCTNYTKAMFNSYISY